jgi:integrase
MAQNKDRLYLRGGVWWTWGWYTDGVKWFASTHQRERRAAQIAARKIAQERAGDRAADWAKAVTLNSALVSLIEALEVKGRRPASLRAIEYHARHLITHLGRDTPLTSIVLAQTTAYLHARLAEPRASKHTIAKELRTLGQAWKRLARLKVVSPPPDLIPDELGTVYKPRKRWLTRDEFERLRGALTTERAQYLTAYCLTGVRKEELTSYQRARDLDDAGQFLRVRGTKTERAERLVPLVHEAYNLFAARDTWAPWHSMRRDLHRACARIGIQPVSANDLRRTFCSWLAQAGVQERQAADLLGHASTAMVRAVYGQLDLEALRRAVAHLSITNGQSAVLDTVTRPDVDPGVLVRKLESALTENPSPYGLN